MIITTIQNSMISMLCLKIAWHGVTWRKGWEIMPWVRMQADFSLVRLGKA